jgi:putative phage-type endonuclease
MEPWRQNKMISDVHFDVVDDNAATWEMARKREVELRDKKHRHIAECYPFGPSQADAVERMDCEPAIGKLLQAHPLVMQHSKRWHKLRQCMLTASNAPAVCGTNAWCSAEKMFQRKTGQLKLDGEASDATRYGNEFEPYARAKVVSHTGLSLVEVWDAEKKEVTGDVGLRQHPKYPWLGASPDGLFKCGFMLEIKCPKTRSIKHLCPPEYYPQVQVQLEVCDLEYCIFAQFRPPSIFKKGELDLVLVQRDRAWFASKLATVFLPFWERVVAWHADPSHGGNVIRVPLLSAIDPDSDEEPDVVVPDAPPKLKRQNAMSPEQIAKYARQ